MRILPSRDAIIAATVGFGVSATLVVARDLPINLAGLGGLAAAGLVWSTFRSMQRLRQTYARHQRHARRAEELRADTPRTETPQAEPQQAATTEERPTP